MPLVPSLNQFGNNATNSLVALDTNFTNIATALNTTLPGTTGAAQVGTANGATVQAAITSLLAGTAGGVGFRNRIINGDMRIDQRHNGASQTIVAAAAAVYTVDRFYASCTGANVAGQRIAGTNADQYLYQFTGAASVSGITFGQRIEATNIWDLNGANATFSVEISNSALTTVTWTAYIPTVTDNWASQTQIATGTFTVTSVLTTYSVTISLPTSVTAGLAIQLSVGAQTSGTWVVGEWQLEQGSTATAFERIPFSLSETLCQRYLPAFNSTGTVSPIGMYSVNLTTQTQGNFPFRVRARVPPTGISATAASGFISSAAASAIAFAFASNDSAIINMTVAGATVGQAGQWYANSASAQLLFTGCEL